MLPDEGRPPGALPQALEFGYSWSRRERSRLAQGFNLGFQAPETVQVPKGRLKFIPINTADRIPPDAPSAREIFRLPEGGIR